MGGGGGGGDFKLALGYKTHIIKLCATWFSSLYNHSHTSAGYTIHSVHFLNYACINKSIGSVCAFV